MYITLEQAKQYVNEYYTSSAPMRILWDSLLDEDKQIALNRAEQQIDQLTLNGHALVNGKAFPRTPNSEESLKAAKTATVELAVQSLDEQSKSRFDLQRQGVSGYKIGDLSENFSGGHATTADAFVVSIVSPILKEWLGGGYKICTQIRR